MRKQKRERERKECEPRWEKSETNTTSVGNRGVPAVGILCTDSHF